MNPVHLRVILKSNKEELHRFFLLLKTKIFMPACVELINKDTGEVLSVEQDGRTRVGPNPWNSCWGTTVTQRTAEETNTNSSLGFTPKCC